MGAHESMTHSTQRLKEINDVQPDAEATGAVSPRLNDDLDENQNQKGSDKKSPQLSSLGMPRYSSVSI